MKKKITYLEGYFEGITEPKTLERPGKKSVQSSLVTISTEDGQKGFFEVRDSIIKAISMLGISLGDAVKVGFVFIGNEKGDKKFNNLFINEIEML